MKFGVSFAANEPNSLPGRKQGLLQAVEAVISSRSVLLDDVEWERSWDNIREATLVYGPKNVSFHFPVYHCCYTTDLSVQQRLFEAFSRATDLGLAGVTVCSNQVKTVRHWQNCNIQEERLKLVELLTEVRESRVTDTWLALENMPLFSEGGSSPLFCQPGEFSTLHGTPIMITWDFGNFVETLLATSGLHRIACRSLPLKHLHGGQFLDFGMLKSNVAHWHFSAIEPVRDSGTPSGRERKVSPQEGILPESIYRDALEIMLGTGTDSHVIFELTEQTPKRLQDILVWAEGVRHGDSINTCNYENKALEASL